MKNLNKYTFLVLAFGLFIVAGIIENSLLKKHPEKHLVVDFQEELIQNEILLDNKIQQVADSIVSAEITEGYNEYFGNYKLNNLLKGSGFLIYRDGILQFWSNRSIAFYENISNFKSTNGLVVLPNGYYLARAVNAGNTQIVGLHLIKYKYPFENKYLKNIYNSYYSLPKDFIILEGESEQAYPVRNNSGEYLFSVLPSGQYLCTTNQLLLPAIIYFLGLIVLLLYFRKEFLGSKANFILRILALATALFIVYWLHLVFHIPKVFFHLQFFSPEYFALNTWLPSLGDFFLMAVFFFFWMYNFGIELSLKKMHEDSGLSRKVITAFLLLFSAATYLLVNFYIEKLIFNSTISFSLNKIIEITSHSIIGMFSIGLLLLAIISFTIRVCRYSKKDFSFIGFVGLISGISAFLAVVQYVAVGKIELPALLLFFVSSLFAILFSRNFLRYFTLSYLIVFVAAASVYSLYILYFTSSQKERNHQKLLAVTLVAEHDPAAEVFLAQINDAIAADPAIRSLVIQNEDPTEYIQQTYFNSYFRKFLFNVNICTHSDSLFVEPEKITVPCNPFYNELISIQGMQIAETNFYFMDNMNGRISYTGKFSYPHTNNDSVSIYIDLDSDLLFEGIGFPELLIDNKIVRSDNYKKFDYAKYYGGELTDKFGEYNYNFYVDSYSDVFNENEFVYSHWDGLEHLIYHTREDNYVIVSRNKYSLTDYLISFPYIFVFYFISVLFLIFVGNRSFRTRPVKFDLKFKIQASIISIVFISLLVVALVTIFYNIESYRAKHRDDLNEKMRSIVEEIDNRLEDKELITNEIVEWLYRELDKLSNIFRTDINIYGTDGNLLASSRSEIFEQGLVSTRINARAYYEIFENFQVSYFQPEQIGELSYLSAYRPIINNKGEYLGFINLPYFIKQDNYSQEISTFVVAFINLYVLLLLASIIVAVFIANQITKPLVLIQENLRKMVLGKRNEPIQYSRKDEIGSLVQEYNKKVDELAVSAELLARSERESAWREMAKQIAHEIKNPLTPMKLNIQYLQRKKGNDKEFNKYLERVTNTLIEQIDNLSNIATEFSNFAKIPTARNQVINLAAQIQKVIDLFESHDRAQISFNPGNYSNLEVNADREQLSRAIINLIKNGIQAVPDDEIGEIEIVLKRREHMAVIEVKDNGTGIPVELRDKLFSPSFTTKTSGMGLGLAIVKNIVENFSGRIWFETEQDQGTTFFIEIPVYNESEI